MSKRSGSRQKRAVAARPASKRRQFSEFLKRILDALGREEGFQEAEELIAELKGWAGNYLPGLVRQIEEASAQQRQGLLNLIAYLEDPQAILYLERLIFESPVDLAAKQRAAQILDQLGSPLEVGMAESLENAAAFLQGVPAIKPESLHGSHPLFVKFVQLPPTLRQAALIDLASSNPEVALDFIGLMQRRERRPHAEAIEALSLMADPRAAKILREFLEGAQDKETVRLVRRALYRLRSRGVRVDGDDTTPPPHQGIYRPVVVQPQGFMSVFDGSGARLVWLARPVPGGGRALYHAVVSDTRGLLDFGATEVSLRSFRSYVGEVTGQDAELLVREIPAEYAAHLMEEAYRLSRDRGGQTPQEYPIHRHQIEAVLGDRTPSLDLSFLEAREEAGAGIARQEMEELLERPEFAGWGIEEEVVSPFVEEVNAALEGQVLVSASVRRDQVEEICRKAASTLFDSDRLKRLVTQLRETAYVLHKAGRTEVARLAFAVAETLRKEDADPAGHSFLYGMVRRSVLGPLLERSGEGAGGEASESEGGSRSKESSLIITPDQVRGA